MNDAQMSQITFDIETLVNECQPETILQVGDETEAFTENYTAQKKLLNQTCSVTVISADSALAQLRQPQRFDVGVVANTLEFLDKDTAGQLIARLRDLHTDRFVVVVRMGAEWQQINSVWQTSDLLGFGMKLVGRYEVESKPVHLYKYDITTYKKTPEWLNASNWANPNMWGKFRW